MKRSSFSVLNWKELDNYCRTLQHQCSNLYIDRIFIPERSQFPDGFLKNEWALKLASRDRNWNLVVSVRPQRPSITLLGEKQIRNYSQASRSPFDLALSKLIRGSKLLEIAPLPRERTVVLRISADRSVSPCGELQLMITLVPAQPEAMLVLPNESRVGSEGKVLARSRHEKMNSNGDLFIPPDGARAPLDMPVREELIESPESFSSHVESSLLEEAFDLRVARAHRRIRELLKNSESRLREAMTAAEMAEKEQDWLNLGHLLKGSMGQSTPSQRKKGRNGSEILVRTVKDYVRDQDVEIECDPKLTLTAQVERFYQLAKRRQRRESEALERAESAEAAVWRLKDALHREIQSQTWEELEKLERAAGFVSSDLTAGTGAAPTKGSIRKWSGRQFLSRDGQTILVGKSKDENLELTFKVARGNDLWMHVRGKPGAHVVIPLHSGKSASLETLLDAAHLTVFYSGGENWGTTEVDYTFKKHVKRIKDSTEASYTQNKTLLIQSDTERLKRLLSQTESPTAGQTRGPAREK